MLQMLHEDDLQRRFLVQYSDSSLLQHCSNIATLCYAKNRRYESFSATFPLDWQNNSSARASRFFVHFFTVTARLQREDV